MNVLLVVLFWSSYLFISTLYGRVTDKNGRAYNLYELKYQWKDPLNIQMFEIQYINCHEARLISPQFIKAASRRQVQALLDRPFDLDFCWPIKTSNAFRERVMTDKILPSIYAKTLKRKRHRPHSMRKGNAVIFTVTIPSDFSIETLAALPANPSSHISSKEDNNLTLAEEPMKKLKISKIKRNGTIDMIDKSIAKSKRLAKINMAQTDSKAHLNASTIPNYSSKKKFDLLKRDEPSVASKNSSIISVSSSSEEDDSIHEREPLNSPNMVKILDQEQIDLMIDELLRESRCRAEIRKTLTNSDIFQFEGHSNG